MKRSSKAELTQRINRAFSLLEQGLAQNQVKEALKIEFGISDVQAYRYVHQAKGNITILPIPEATKVFTVKLAPGVIEQLRGFSQSKGLTISRVVSQALEDFLNKKEHGQEKGYQGD